MAEMQKNEAQNLPAPQTGVEQRETHEVNMETKEQIAPVATLGQQLAGDEATKVPTPETAAAPAAEEETPESTEEEVDGTTMTDVEKLAFLEDVDNLPTLATILSFLPKSIQKQIVIRVSYRKIADEGAVMVYSDVNRNIDNAQVGRLKKSLEGKKVKVYKKAATVIRLRDILEYQAKYVNEPDRRHFFRFDTGEEITLATPTEILDNCYYVDDGQHRIFTCMEDTALDVNLEILPYTGEDLQESVTIQNSIDKNWSKADYERSYIESGKFVGTHYQQRDQLVKILGITPKTAEMYLTFKADANTKSQLAKGKEGIVWNDSDCQRGEDLAYAVRVMSQSSQVKKIAMIKAIVYTYDQSSDEIRGNFRDVMVSLLTSLSEEDVTTICSYISGEDYGQLNKYLREKFDSFRANHTDDLAGLVDAANKKIADIKTELGATPIEEKLRQARPEVLLEYRRKQAAKKAAGRAAAAERAKAKKDAEKTVKTAEKETSAE